MRKRSFTLGLFLPLFTLMLSMQGPYSFAGDPIDIGKSEWSTRGVLKEKIKKFGKIQGTVFVHILFGPEGTQTVSALQSPPQFRYSRASESTCTCQLECQNNFPVADLLAEPYPVFNEDHEYAVLLDLGDQPDRFAFGIRDCGCFDNLGMLNVTIHSDSLGSETLAVPACGFDAVVTEKSYSGLVNLTVSGLVKRGTSPPRDIHDGFYAFALGANEFVLILDDGAVQPQILGTYVANRKGKPTLFPKVKTFEEWMKIFLADFFEENFPSSTVDVDVQSMKVTAKPKSKKGVETIKVNLKTKFVASAEVDGTTSDVKVTWSYKGTGGRP